MAFHVRATEHAGPKRRLGGHWGPKSEAKHESARVRRRIGDREAIEESAASIDPCVKCGESFLSHPNPDCLLHVPLQGW